MKGFIEIKEDSYEDTIEHLYRIKLLACKLIKTLSESSEVYNKDYSDDESDMRYKQSDTFSSRSRGRYSY